MNLNGRVMECEGSNFSGVATGPVQELDTTGSGASKCSWFAGAGELQMNSCKFILHPGNPSGTVEIGPAGCGGATLTTTECTWSIPPQGIATNYYPNNASKPESVSMATNGGFSYTVVKGSLFVCGKGTITGSLGAQWGITAQLEGGPISATVTDHPAVGIFLTGSELAAESYPVSLGGVQSASAKRIFDFYGRTVTCNEAGVAGKATGSSSKFELSPSYSGCSAFLLGSTLPATVDASGCTEAYSVTASKAPYTASMDLNCSSALKVVVTGEGGTTVCTYTVTTQSGLGAINLANTGSGSSRGVDVEWQIGALPYTRTTGSAVVCGKASTTATATGTVQVHGSI
jgi:hypothetical protein